MAATVLVGLTVACGDELGGILAEIEDIYDRARTVLERQIEQAASDVAAAEAEEAAAAADIVAAQEAVAAVPRLPPISVDVVLDPERMAARTERVRARSQEIRRLTDVLNAARLAEASAQGARRTAERQGAAAERTIERHRQRLQSLREAYEEDTWDLLAISQFSSALGQEVSPRSILIDARRDAEAELARVEAGEPPSLFWP